MAGLSSDPSAGQTQGIETMKAPKPGKPKPKVKAAKTLAKRKKAA